MRHLAIALALALTLAALAAMAQASGRSGEDVYKSKCHFCHDTGAAGAPKTGDKAAWKPRIAKGMPALYDAALHGLRAMPPKGGCGDCTDGEVEAAVDYMVGKSK